MANGEFYFSPNNLRAVSTPPKYGEDGHTLVGFHPCVTKSNDFQAPRWWSARTEWLAFIPLLPAPYRGYWFQALNASPKDIVSLPSGEARLNRDLLGSWTKAEHLVVQVTNILARKNHFDYSEPYHPSAWRYDKIHPTLESAEYHISNGREWFAVWIGLLYWMTQKVPELTSFREGITAPRWYIQVVQGWKDQVVYDAIRTMPMLNHNWDWSRVGLWLHFPSDEPLQPKAHWFIKCGVPIWYRWGGREREAFRRDPAFGLIAPTPEELQAVTTFLTSTPSVIAPADFGAQSFDQTLMYPADSCFARLDDAETETTGETTEPPASKNLSCQAEAARKSWDDFWQKREELHVHMREKETGAEKQWHQSREKDPRETRAEVYVWEWNDDSPPNYVCKRVSKADRSDELRAHNNKGSISRYDLHLNEWHCASHFDLNPSAFEDVSDFNDDVGAMSAIPPVACNTSTTNTITGRTQQRVTRLLALWFGFVPPLPLPESSNNIYVDEDRKSLIAVLAIDKSLSSLDFFQQPLGIICTSFLKSFTRKNAAPPGEDLWDLVETNRQSLKYTMRLNSIRTVKAENGSWYMFDFESSRTVPWNLAVRSPAAALYVCRLDDSMTEVDIALDLAQEGIQFHTLQLRDTLPRAPGPWSPPIFIPMRLSDHVFNITDHNFYRYQCKEILSLPRARAAIMRGGFCRRIALEYISPLEALKGPSGVYNDPAYMFVARDSSGYEYADDALTVEELEALSGLYVKFTGKGEQTGRYSWYPLPHIFEGSGEDLGRWTDRLEQLWERCNKVIHSPDHLEKHLDLPLTAKNWRNWPLRGYGDARKAWNRVELLSKNYIKDQIGDS